MKEKVETLKEKIGASISTEVRSGLDDICSKPEVLLKAEISVSFQALIEGKKKAEDKLIKAQTPYDRKLQKLEEINQLILQNKQQIDSAEIGDLEKFSQVRLHLSKEKSEIEEFLNDMQRRLSPLRADLSGKTEDLRQAVHEHLFVWRDAYNLKFSLYIYNIVEPMITAMTEAVLAISDAYQLKLHKRDVVCQPEFYSLLVSSVCNETRDPKLMKI